MEGYIVLIGQIFGPDLLIVVIIVAALVFGGSAIPKLARNLGQVKNEFEKGSKSTKTAGSSSLEAASFKESDTNK